MNSPGFLGRRLQGLHRRWQNIAGSEYDAEAASLRPDLPPEDRPRLLKRMEQCLQARGGEILARSKAAALGRVYLNLNQTGREAFLRILAGGFDLDEEAVARASAAMGKAGTPEARRTARRALLEATESPRTRILTRFNALPQGVKFLVDLRADLLPLAKQDPVLASLDDDLRGLLTAWFDPGFLQLRRISWNTASGALLEKFMAYEAVHPVESWDDLKNRLDHDRRYFAFFHPRMPEEPLIFIEVALVRGLVGNIRDLLDPTAPQLDPGKADSAIFYSISNAQKGLAGIAFGGFLIKRVVDELAGEFRDLSTFATLSPLPGFRRWLDGGSLKQEDLLRPPDVKRLKRLAGASDLVPWLSQAVDDNRWLEGPEVERKELVRAIRPILLRQAARFLTREQRVGGGALDPVAHFHLSNGARIERLNWGGDTSPRGLAQSAGIMVNYLYDSRKIEENHEAYRGRGRIVTSPSVRGLLKN